jgi:hypothetical protein
MAVWHVINCITNNYTDSNLYLLNKKSVVKTWLNTIYKFLFKLLYRSQVCKLPRGINYTNKYGDFENTAAAQLNKKKSICDRHNKFWNPFFDWITAPHSQNVTVCTVAIISFWMKLLTKEYQAQPSRTRVLYASCCQLWPKWEQI